MEISSNKESRNMSRKTNELKGKCIWTLRCGKNRGKRCGDVYPDTPTVKGEKHCKKHTTRRQDWQGNYYDTHKEVRAKKYIESKIKKNNVDYETLSEDQLNKVAINEAIKMRKCGDRNKIFINEYKKKKLYCEAKTEKGENAEKEKDELTKLLVKRDALLLENEAQKKVLQEVEKIQTRRKEKTSRKGRELAAKGTSSDYFGCSSSLNPPFCYTLYQIKL